MKHVAKEVIFSSPKRQFIKKIKELRLL